MEKEKFKFDPLMLAVTVLLFPLTFLWFIWLSNSIFEDTYGMIGSFVAIFGGFFGSIMYQIQKYKKYKNKK